MNAITRLTLAATATAALGGCNLVMTEKPMFVLADGASAPPLRQGVWRIDKSDCPIDETLPQDKWPRCADASPGVGPKPFWLEAAGDPDLLQTPPLQIPLGQGTKPFYLYEAIRPLKLDPQGRVIAMKTWSVRCGPPPPPDPQLAAAEARADAEEAQAERETPAAPGAARGPGLTSLTDPSSLTPHDGSPAGAAPSAEDAAMRAKLKTDLAKLRKDTKRLAAQMARMTPTKAPLPGLVMNQMGGCSVSTVEALRRAAVASEAWAEEDAVTHWVRDPVPGDLPPLSADKLSAMASGN